MDLGLAGRVAIVTGASRGIGKACAAELAPEGADVVLLSKDFARNEAACAELRPHAKGRVVGAPADLNDEAAVRAVFARTIEEFGRPTFSSIAVR
jgi:3-oxoacyl-[acyl-carrier protein] reductase